MPLLILTLYVVVFNLPSLAGEIAIYMADELGRKIREEICWGSGPVRSPQQEHI